MAGDFLASCLLLLLWRLFENGIEDGVGDRSPKL